MVELFANSGDPDQMPHSAASDLGLHCLAITLLGISRLQWVNVLLCLVGAVRYCEHIVGEETAGCFAFHYVVTYASSITVY